MFVCTWINICSVVFSGPTGQPKGNIIIYTKDYIKNAYKDLKKTLASVGIDIANEYLSSFPGFP